jgi:hypothetical protein
MYKDSLDKLFTGGKPVESLSLKVVGGGGDGHYFDIVIKLRALQIRGGEEDVVDKIIKSGAVEAKDPDVVSQILWHIASRRRNRSAIIYRDPSTGLGIMISMLYYAVKVVAPRGSASRVRRRS